MEAELRKRAEREEKRNKRRLELKKKQIAEEKRLADLAKKENGEKIGDDVEI